MGLRLATYDLATGRAVNGFGEWIERMAASPVALHTAGCPAKYEQLPGLRAGTLADSARGEYNLYGFLVSRFWFLVRGAASQPETRNPVYRLKEVRAAMLLARRNLSQDRTRLGLSIAGVALAVMLILILNGFLTGMYVQFAAYLDHAPGSVVVAQAGVGNLLGATSLLPADAADTTRQVAGVARVVPILSQFIILDVHGQKQPAYLVGYDLAAGGGPWRLAGGREPASDGEMVFDRVMAERHGLRISHQLELMGRQFTIVGLSDDTTSWMTSFLFIRKTAAESLLRAPGATSFLLLTPAEGVAPETLLDRLRDGRGTEALLKTRMIANDSKLFGSIFSAPLQLMVSIAFLVGTLVVGLVTYTATVERQREYGVLKAIGATNGMLYRVVVAQAMVAAGAGAAAGVGLALVAGQVIMALRPQFLIAFEPAAVGRALAVGLAMALLASLVPARVIGGLAPADVFRR
ncbi:MAG: ABC transporter permease [Chloroflexi bacterium]|nr:ABC transporter permease [Chloroflexota bacterium]